MSSTSTTGPISCRAQLNMDDIVSTTRFDSSSSRGHNNGFTTRHTSCAAVRGVVSNTTSPHKCMVSMSSSNAGKAFSNVDTASSYADVVSKTSSSRGEAIDDDIRTTLARRPTRTNLGQRTKNNPLVDTDGRLTTAGSTVRARGIDVAVAAVVLARGPRRRSRAIARTRTPPSRNRTVKSIARALFRLFHDVVVATERVRASTNASFVASSMRHNAHPRGHEQTRTHCRRAREFGDTVAPRRARRRPRRRVRRVERPIAGRHTFGRHTFGRVWSHSRRHNAPPPLVA